MQRLFSIGQPRHPALTACSQAFAQGIGLNGWGQGFINMGVNLGVLPTKGLTLPLVSYGGSAILMIGRHRHGHGAQGLTGRTGS